MYRRTSKNANRPGFLKRAVRSTISITVLTTLILGIALLMREASSIDSQKLATLSGPLLDTLGIEDITAGQVAGNKAKRTSKIVTEVFPTKANQNSEVIDQNTGSARSVRDLDKTVLFSVGIFADSHSDLTNLSKAIELAKEEEVSALFHLGDLTDLGVVRYLEESKSILDSSGIDYYAIPGDRDLWESVGPENFISVFGDNKYSVIIEGYKFVVLDNSANYTVLSQELINWFNTEVVDADFVLLSQPLYHPSNDKVMGVTSGEEVGLLKEQADSLLNTIRKSNVKAIIAAEQHMSSEHPDLEKPELTHIVVGAITSTINDKPQELLQKSRFSTLKVYEDATYEIFDVILP